MSVQKISYPIKFGVFKVNIGFIKVSNDIEVFRYGESNTIPSFPVRNKGQIFP